MRKEDLLTEEEKNMISNMLSKLELNDNINKVDAVLDLINESLESLDCVINRYEE